MTNVAITTTHQISPPYPGTAPFQDKREDRLVFYGRDQEVHALMELVLSESQVLLFARSGLGKTSLINAGLLEKLRERNFFPVTVRVTDDEDGGPIAAILHRINEEAAIHGVQVKGNQDAPSLWAYFDQVRFLRNEPIKSKPVSLRPILVFDQFEEVFTLLPKDRRETFISDLADLVCGQAPRHVRNEALKKLDEISDDNPERQRIMDLAYGRPIIDVKVLISIREDFLAEL